MQRNTFQVVLATDGSSTYVMFLYGEMGWGREPTIGFNAGDFTCGYTLPQSAYGGSVSNLTSSSNFGQPGTFLFRVDQNDIIGKLIASQIFRSLQFLHQVASSNALSK